MNITKENVYKYIEAVYDRQSNETQQFNDDAPKWFIYLINYWKYRDELLELFQSVGISIPTSFISNFQHPSEWSKETIHLFLDTLTNHYVCNSCIFSQNLGFWYKRYAQFSFNTEKWLKGGNYSDTPWQLVLGNPNWDDTEIILRVIEALNERSMHSYYLLHLPRYAAISDKNLYNILRYVQWEPYKKDKYLLNEAVHFITLCIDGEKSYPDAVYDILYSSVSTTWVNDGDTNKINSLPEKYRVQWLRDVSKDNLWKAAQVVTLPKRTIVKVLEERL